MSWDCIDARCSRGGDCLPAAVLTLAVLAMLFSLPATFFAGYDFVTMHEMHLVYLRDTVLQGDFPWWNPFTALGRPFFADIETATAYPPTWLVVPLGVPLGAAVGVGLHCWLAILGTRRLAGYLGATPIWAWLAAGTFVCGGPLLARLLLGQLKVFSGLCWLPLILWLGLRLQDRGTRAIAPLALAECLCLLAGSPNAFWLANVGLVLVLCARAESLKRAAVVAGQLAVALLLAACIGAVQLVPFLELIREGNRPLHAVEYATRNGMGWTTWVSLVVPLGGPFKFAPEFNQYVGAPFAVAGLACLVLRGRERNVRAILVLVVAAVLLGSGDRLPVLGWLADSVPGFGAMRYPSRYGLLGSFGLVLAGAVWLGGKTTRASRTAIVLLVALQAVLLIYGAVQMSAHYRTTLPKYWDSDLRDDLANHGYFPANGVPPRVAFGPNLVRPNSGMREGYSTLDGFANPMLRRTWVSVHREANVPEPSFEFQQLSPAIYERGPFPMPSGVLVAGWDPKLGVTRFRPLAEAGARVWLEPPDESQPAISPRPPDDRVTIIRFERNSVLVRAEAVSPARLVLAEPYYPGWRARINGRDVAVEPANGWMRCVSLPAGVSTVQFEFRPRGLATAVVLSLSGLLAVVLLWRRTGAAPAPAQGL